MTDKPLFVILGWEPSAEQSIAFLSSRGMEIAVVGGGRAPDLPKGARFVEGATDDAQALREAGVERAAGILCFLPAAAARRAAAAARALRPGIPLVASVQEGDSKGALLDAGAGAAIDPQEETAREMLRLMFAERP